MKRSFYIILVFSVSLVSCSEPSSTPTIDTDNKFLSISPAFETGEYTSAWFFNATDALVSTNTGALLTSTNTGETWGDSNVYEENYLDGLFFVNNKLGFCTNNDTSTYQYTNEKWSLFDFPVKNTKPSSFYTLNNQHLYATTARGSNTLSYLLHSANTGETWDTVHSAYADFKQVLMLDENLGFVISHNENKLGLLKTTDGGHSWYGRIASSYGSYFSETAHLTKVLAIDNDHLICIGRGAKANEGLLFTSSDGGEYWDFTFVNHALNDMYITTDYVYFAGDELFVAQWPISTSRINPITMIEDWNQYDRETDFILDNTGTPVLHYSDVIQIQFTDDESGFIIINGDSKVFKIKVTTEKYSKS